MARCYQQAIINKQISLMLVKINIKTINMLLVYFYNRL